MNKAADKYVFNGTPGPWTVGKKEIVTIHHEDETYKSGRIPINSKNWYEVIVCYKHELSTIKTSMANAHLVSAAPELLQACINIEKLIGSKKSWTKEERKIYQQTRLAIHKALNIKK